MIQDTHARVIPGSGVYNDKTHAALYGVEEECPRCEEMSPLRNITVGHIIIIIFWDGTIISHPHLPQLKHGLNCVNRLPTWTPAVDNPSLNQSWSWDFSNRFGMEGILQLNE